MSRLGTRMEAYSYALRRKVNRKGLIRSAYTVVLDFTLLECDILGQRGMHRGAHPWVSPRLVWRTHHASQAPRTPCHPRLGPRPLLATARGHRAAAGQGLPHRLLIVVVPSCSVRWAAASARFSALLAR